MAVIDKNQLKIFINQGEDSFTEFKQEAIEQKKFTKSIAGFLNNRGGRVIFGVDDKKNIIGIKDTKEIEKLILTARDQIEPPPTIPDAYNCEIEGKTVTYLSIPEGSYKPYKANGRYFIRFGASSREMTQEELLRAFQSGKRLFAEENKVINSSLEDINLKEFKEFYKNRFDEESVEFLDDINKFKKTANNLKCLIDDNLTLLSALLFCDTPQKYLSSFHIEAIAFKGCDIAGDKYRSSKSIKGNLRKMYEQAKDFVLSNIPYPQDKQGVNSLGKTPLSKNNVLEEILVNALIHRDYFIDAPIRLFVFDDRIEIKSPGNLPNSLTIENISNGVSVRRNQIMCDYVLQGKILPYRGVGSGIKRVKKEMPNVYFENEIDGIGEFTAVIPLSLSSLSDEQIEIEGNKEDILTPELILDIELFIGDFNDLKTELEHKNPDLKDELAVLNNAVNEMEEKETKNEIVKSGVGKKFKRFFDDLLDKNSKLGKTLKGINKGYEIVSDLAEKYNKVAELTGLNPIPKIFLKK